jgi:acetyltransferase-like isoleucine patch superfamily enzyme
MTCNIEPDGFTFTPPPPFHTHLQGNCSESVRNFSVLAVNIRNTLSTGHIQFLSFLHDPEFVHINVNVTFISLTAITVQDTIRAVFK